MSVIEIDDEKKMLELREQTKTFFGLEKPLEKYTKVSVSNLEELVAQLHEAFSSNSVNIELVNHLMMVYSSNYNDWKKYAKFDRYRYTRNLVDSGNGRFNLMILCWNEGQSSTVHDHANSHCFMKVLKGNLVEVKYSWPNEQAASIPSFEPKCITSIPGEGGDYEQELNEISRSVMNTNDVFYINDNIGLHRVENASNVETAVSLHLYCPPYESCSIFNKAGKRSPCRVTFWSKYGKRVKSDEEN